MNNPQESMNHYKDNDFRTIEQTMEKLSGGTRRLAAQLTTSASFDSLWSVLTDYDRLNLYIPNLLSSKKIFQNGNNVHLKQVGAQDFLGMKFSAEVTIDLFKDKSLGLLKYNLIKMLLAEPEKYGDAINAIKKDIAYMPIELKKKLEEENIIL